MKFFKHFTDAHRGQSMRAIREKGGHRAHSAWWILVELCAEKLEKKPNEQYVEADCSFLFTRRYLQDQMGLKAVGLDSVLSLFSEHSLIILRTFSEHSDNQMERSDNVIRIEMPKLLESLDRDTRRARPVRAPCAPKNKNKEKDKEQQQRARASLAEESGDPLSFVGVNNFHGEGEGAAAGFSAGFAEVLAQWPMIDSGSLKRQFVEWEKKLSPPELENLLFEMKDSLEGQKVLNKTGYLVNAIRTRFGGDDR